jgi:chorismate mutase/prephenate dehydratase
MSATIEDWREQIDAVDRELLCLLNRRVRLAIEVGEVKRRDATPLCDPGRERQILLRARQANRGPLDDEAVARIFQCVIDESRLVEGTVRVAS